MNKSKILVISYNITTRTKKFCKYFPQFGITPVTLSSEIDKLSRDAIKKENCYDNYYSYNIIPLAYFASFLKRVGTNFRLFLLPDIYLTWIPQTVLLGLQIIKKQHVSLIYVSCGPFSSSIVGVLLKKITGLPLILDFRDPWTLDPDPDLRYPSEFHKKIDEKFEKWVINNTDFIITATHTIEKMYSEKYPSLKKKIFTIPNGFDDEDIPPEKYEFKKFTILYTGGIYGSGIRPVELFFQAITDSIREYPLMKDNIQILFIGAKDRKLMNDVKSFSLFNIITITDRVPQYEVYKYIQSAHLLLIIELSNAVTTKIYEYLPSGKPILAIIAKGEISDLIERYSDNSYVITSRNVEDIQNALLQEFKKYQKNNILFQLSEKIQIFKNQYNRKKLTSDLSKIIFTLTNKTEFNPILK